MNAPLLDSPAEVVSANQAAKELRVSQPRVVSFIYSGKLPARRGPGRSYSIERADLEAFKLAYAELVGVKNG